MERIETPPGAARGLIVTVAVVLVGIIMGRLVLEGTGAGLVAFALSLPVVFLVTAAFLGLGRAAVLLGLFAGTALLIRVIVLETGWVVLLLAPVIAVTSYVLATTIQVMRRPEPSGEEE